uniref:sugar-binding domain-containing protein n=1 Tax=Alistipes sp. TaxID=1872444 RepID=UPI0040570060
MKRFIFLSTILSLVSIYTVIAQCSYDLSERSVEPARTKLTPYHRVAEAIAGSATTSRFVATIAEPTRKDEGTTSTFTTHFALPTSWLNRQIILRVGYSSSAYTLCVNGREMGFAPTGVMGAEFNITKATKEGRNEIMIVLDKSSLANKLYEPKTLTVEQIEVFTQPTIRIRDIVAGVRLNEQGNGIVEVAIPIKCDALNPKSMRLHYALRLSDSTLVTEGYRELTLDMRREDSLRFACIVPAKALWRADVPTKLRLDLESRIENRIVECVSQNIALRQIEIRNKQLFINNDKIVPNLVEYEAVKSLDEVKKFGYNGIIITLDKGAYKVIEECERRGLYVVVRTPINTNLLGDHIRREGNPSNNPVWNESYLWRNIHALNSTKGYGAVIGYAIAKGKTSGINIYDTYIALKSLLPHHLVIYEGAKGEWATDL